ncbi:MAG: glycosyltransferase family 1 protein [Proteobacteria bacterium]|nr:glycosyltransferase family 1 protein [Pseudomonadota bacterium]
MPDLQIEQIPFPAPVRSAEKKGNQFTLGAYCSFVSNNNLHFLLTIGHYLAKRDDSICLKFWGKGPLVDHLSKLASDLGISKQVQIIPTDQFSEPEFCDVALYFPQKNDHFGALLMAASVGAVPICGNIPGIEKYVSDSVNGFIFQQEETRSIAELILTLKNHPALCRELATRFQRDTFKNFSSGHISEMFLSVFKGNVYQTQNYSRQSL